jgi:murein DD-endopeptidase MepM/ murein hydrolase activator NlpD
MKKYLSVPALLRQVSLRKRLLPALLYVFIIGLLLAAITRFVAHNLRLPFPAFGGQQAVVQEEIPALDPSASLGVPDAVYSPPDLLAPRQKPSEPMQWPLAGEVLTRHHQIYRVGNQLRLHVGIDLAGDVGTLVYAAWPGIVLEVREDVRLGLLLEIDHGGGYVSRYANLSDVFFGAGEEVSAGEAIARVGQTAVLDAAEGAFLHFALYRDGQALDPLDLLPARQANQENSS